MRFCNLWQPNKVDAKGHHQLVKFTQGCCQSFFILYNMRQPHKGGCYGTPSQCNLLQIQSAQLPKSRPCHLQVLRLPRFFFYVPSSGVWFVWACQCHAHATHMQHTCNTHATHMQHTCNTSIFPVNFQATWPRGQKSTLSILRPELGLQTSNPARWL